MEARRLSLLISLQSSACFYSGHAGSWLDCAHSNWGWVCLSQSTDSNINLLWQHPHRHTQEQQFASSNPIKLTLNINHHRWHGMRETKDNTHTSWFRQLNKWSLHSETWNLREWTCFGHGIAINTFWEMVTLGCLWSTSIKNVTSQR